MPNIDISTLEVGGGNFEPPAAGKHHFVIDEAEWTTSKSSGKDMLEVTWIIDDEDDPDVGKQVKDFVVLTYFDKKKGSEVLHWNIPRYFGLAGKWPTKPSERAKLFAPKAAEKTYEAVADGLIGKTGELEIEIQEGRPKIGDDGNPTGDKYGDTGRIKSYQFDDVKRSSASDVTF